VPELIDRVTGDHEGFRKWGRILGREFRSHVEMVADESRRKEFRRVGVWARREAGEPQFSEFRRGRADCASFGRGTHYFKATVRHLQATPLRPYADTPCSESPP
jgi:hypothetical protein